MNRTIPDMMRDVPRPELVSPEWWSKSNDAGWTPGMVQAARDAEIERRLRNRPEVAADD